MKTHELVYHTQPFHLQTPNYGSRHVVRPRKEITVSSIKSTHETHGSGDGEGLHCYICRTTYPSEARYSRHFLTCRPYSPPDVKKEDPVLSIASKITETKTSEVHHVDRSVNGSTEVGLPPALPLSRLQGTTQTTPLSLSSNGGTLSLIENNKTQRSRKKESIPPNSLAKPSRQTDGERATPSMQRSTATAEPHALSVMLDKYTAGQFRCATIGCDLSFRSEAGLKNHQADAHSIGGKRLDLHGKDSWMLNPRMRDQLKQQGVLRGKSPIRPSAKRPTRRAPDGPPTSVNPLLPRRTTSQIIPSKPHRSEHLLPSSTIPLSGPTPVVMGVGGPAEAAQADEICGKIMRLVLQSDVLLHHTGTMTCSGIQWTRVGVAKQGEIPSMFDALCHLPKVLQSEEFVPPPKAFKDEDQCSCLVSDFDHSPDSSTPLRGLAVVAISCVKVLLANDCQEVVKVAALDAITGRILINHLVCTDPTVSVQDWRTKTTGLASFRDLEAARQDGYKIFRGWQAARVALWKYIDKQTIVLGHNIRSDLDALRIIHGRSVDIAKLIEKAAGGPLSKQQLSLEVLCRDLKHIPLTTDPKFGRDALQNAFAVRELGLWRIKNEIAWVKWAKEKSLDYQRLTPGIGA